MGHRPAYLTPEALSVWIPRLIREKRLYAFYKTPEWISLRDEVLEANHHECEDCKKKSPAVIELATCVHHEREITKYPELALSTFYIDEHGQRHQQLHALCARCHNERHDRFSGTKSSGAKHPLTEEKW